MVQRSQSCQISNIIKVRNDQKLYEYPKNKALLLQILLNRAFVNYGQGRVLSHAWNKWKHTTQEYASKAALPTGTKIVLLLEGKAHAIRQL